MVPLQSLGQSLMHFGIAKNLRMNNTFPRVAASTKSQLITNHHNLIERENQVTWCSNGIRINTPSFPDALQGLRLPNFALKLCWENGPGLHKVSCVIEERARDGLAITSRN